MIGAAYTYIILSLVMLIAGIGLLVVSVNIYFTTKETSKQLMSSILQRSKSVRYKLNSIATMKPKELEEYLSNQLTYVLTLTSAEVISDKDPSARSKLYAASLVKFIELLTPANIDAIEFFYGPEYVMNWFSVKYRLLDLDGTLTTVINKGAVMLHGSVK